MTSRQQDGAITVIIPLYNKAGTIARTIESILRQTDPVSEIILVDDGSTDASADIVEARYAGKVTLVRQENGGPGAARNTGARRATTRFLAFLDADDEWRPTFAAEARRVLGMGAAGGVYVCGYDAGNFSHHRPNKVAQLGKAGWASPPLEADGPTIKLHVDAMHSSCVVVRRDVFDRAGGYYTRDRCRYGEDSYLWLNILLRERVYWDPRALVDFHVEDSALGFAVSERTSARPIVTDPAPLREGLRPFEAEAMDRAIATFSRIDVDAMRRSGAFFAASRVGLGRGVVSPLDAVRDPLRYVRRYLCQRRG